MSDTPRTNFVAHATGDSEWDRSINRFGRMMAHARILERELAAAIEEIATLREFAEHLLVVHNHTEPLVASYIVDKVLRKCGK